MKKIAEKGFTLIELLIVIGIIGVLAAVLIVNLTPGEAQKKARDSQRMKDVGTLQAIFQQCTDDGVCAANFVEESHNGNINTGCDSNWTGINLCDYASKVPVDPKNNQAIRYLLRTGSLSNTTARYRVRVWQGGYRIATLLESESNLDKLDDGGKADDWYEVSSSTDVIW